MKINMRVKPKNKYNLKIKSPKWIKNRRMKNGIVNIKDKCDLMEIYMGVKLQGNMSCNEWGLVNTREKGVANNNERKSMRKIERKFIDTTNPYPVNTSSTK